MDWTEEVESWHSNPGSWTPGPVPLPAGSRRCLESLKSPAWVLADPGLGTVVSVGVRSQNGGGAHSQEESLVVGHTLGLARGRGAEGAM